MVILGSVHWKIIWGTKNGFSMASLQKQPFGTFIFMSVHAHCTLHDLILLRKFMCMPNALVENTSLSGFYIKVGTLFIYLFISPGVVSSN